jgi:hypothetical protein
VAYFKAVFDVHLEGLRRTLDITSRPSMEQGMKILAYAA